MTVLPFRPRPEPPSVLCDACGSKLPKGSEYYRVPTPGGVRTVCADCLARQEDDSE